MSLLNQSVQVNGQLPKLLEVLRQGQAPEKFNRQFLRDINFKSSNHLQFIPLLKGLGFLTSDGSPTDRYMDFLDSTRWKKVLGEAVREAYSDIFILKSRPTDADRGMIAGKYKSAYNLSDVAADRAARTFLALLDLSDPDTVFGKATSPKPNTAPLASVGEEILASEPTSRAVLDKRGHRPDMRLHYNIQIHLPATKDVEVYNAIFRSLRENLIE